MTIIRNGSRYVRGGLKQRTSVDPRRFMLSNFMTSGEGVAWSRTPRNSIKGYGVGALGNDEVGCCVRASIAHLINHVRMANHTGPIITRDEVLASYRERTGWDPEIDATDQGEYLVDVIKEWKRDGIFHTHIIAFVELDPNDRDQIAFACSSLGGVLFGFGLPKSIQDQGDTWQTDPDSNTEVDKPWSLGGHAILCTDSSPYLDTGMTWGNYQCWTDQWRCRYASQAHAVVLEECADKLRSPLSGLDLDGLMRAADEVRRL